MKRSFSTLFRVVAVLHGALALCLVVFLAVCAIGILALPDMARVFDTLPPEIRLLYWSGDLEAILRGSVLPLVLGAVGLGVACRIWLHAAVLVRREPTSDAFLARLRKVRTLFLAGFGLSVAGAVNRSLSDVDERYRHVFQLLAPNGMPHELATTGRHPVGAAVDLLMPNILGANALLLAGVATLALHLLARYRRSESERLQLASDAQLTI